MSLHSLCSFSSPSSALHLLTYLTFWRQHQLRLILQGLINSLTRRAECQVTLIVSFSKAFNVAEIKHFRKLFHLIQHLF